jgi:hypothetical protein
MDIEQAKLDPATVFRHPEDVLKVVGVSTEDKKAILLRWEEDAEALIRATEEGMPPSDNRGPGELLREVQAALQALGPKSPR